MRDGLRSCITLIVIVVIISVVYAQDEPPRPVGVTITTESATEGYTLFSPAPLNIVYLIDKKGQVVHQWQTENPIFNSYLLENGDLLALIRVGNETPFPAGGTGQVQRLSWDGEVLWQFDLARADRMIHHDLAMMPSGNILMLMWERVEQDDFAQYGINPADVPENAPAYFDIIIEVEPLSGEIIWQWRTLENSIQTFNADAPNNGVPAANPHLVDVNHTDRVNPTADRTHFNAIDYHPGRDQILVSAHFQSEIWVIDRGIGDLVYRWGNPVVYGRGLPENRKLFNQHNPVWLENGNILIFNNGIRDLRPYSSVIEITPPLLDDGSYSLLTGSAYAPLDLSWEYAPRNEDEFFARNVSGAQRLSNGHTFITDGPGGRIFEINSDQNIVWEYINPVWLTADEPRPTTIFRATHYMRDYPAFAGRDLSPGESVAYTLIDTTAPPE